MRLLALVEFVKPRASFPYLRVVRVEAQVSICFGRQGCVLGPGVAQPCEQFSPVARSGYSDFGSSDSPTTLS
jgi:hypothetical protein